MKKSEKSLFTYEYLSVGDFNEWQKINEKEYEIKLIDFVTCVDLFMD